MCLIFGIQKPFTIYINMAFNIQFVIHIICLMAFKASSSLLKMFDEWEIIKISFKYLRHTTTFIIISSFRIFSCFCRLSCFFFLHLSLVLVMVQYSQCSVGFRIKNTYHHKIFSSAQARAQSKLCIFSIFIPSAIGYRLL